MLAILFKFNYNSPILMAFGHSLSLFFFSIEMSSSVLPYSVQIILINLAQIL